MSDYAKLPLLDRLRWRYAGLADVGELNRAMREAADEIERLRDELSEEREAHAKTSAEAERFHDCYQREVRKIQLDLIPALTIARTTNANLHAIIRKRAGDEDGALP